ncbi:MAG: hypothetical protein AAGA80_01080 [Cyanobacteria bacterium P01_F01_bin.143]
MELSNSSNQYELQRIKHYHRHLSFASNFKCSLMDVSDRIMDLYPDDREMIYSAIAFLIPSAIAFFLF